jgi:hypothetical protein
VDSSKEIIYATGRDITESQARKELHATNQIELKLEEGEVEEESDYKFKNYIEKCA